MFASLVPTEIVESILLTLETDPPKHEVALKFRKRGHEFSLRARDVDSMLVTDFLEQNIVDEVRILGHDSDSKEVRDLLANLLFHRVDSSAILSHLCYRSRRNAPRRYLRDVKRSWS
jgi:hypothetical protein